ncbi:MAG: hypothetical protein CTY19_17865 [Methylomonas sp.]|nr:MAG: hypothetical protein CTY19_17865 [Methylomonas sp.]
MISVIYRDTEIIQALLQLEQATGNLAPALRDIGDVLIESTKQRFADGEAQDGKSWAENSQVTIDRKGRSDPLIDSGTLSEQLTRSVFGRWLAATGHTFKST